VKRPVVSGVVVTITRRTLRAHGACSDGIKLFEALRLAQGRRCSVRVTWDLLGQLWLAQAFPSFASWLREHGLTPQVSAPNANLVGANLDGANLVGAYLAGAYLARAYLDGANLVGAYLVGANLVGANLVGAYLAGANLVGANLDGANLDGANLDGAYRPSVSWGYSDLPDGWERDENGCLRRPAKEPAR
jgi:uncharacterized protein YjbI with pentapeptide repeats